MTLTLTDEKQRLGDELFEKVAEIESELCAQITGKALLYFNNIIIKP